MVFRGRSLPVAILSAVALATACELAYAEPSDGATRGTASVATYTLAVESDAPEVVSYEALAARIGADLGGAVARPGAATDPRAAIWVQYRDRVLVVRAVHADGRVLERTVRAEGDDAAVQREAVLLAANLARDEAREILDALAARPAPPAASASAGSSAPAPPVIAPPATPAPGAATAPPVDEGYQPFSVAFFWPIATNAAHPDVRSVFHLGLLYGRVGTVDGVQIGGVVAHASRAVPGAQIGGAASVATGDVAGAQIAGAANVVDGDMAGAQIGGVANVVSGAASGFQAASAANVAAGGMGGVHVAGAVNVARGDAIGLQLAGAANVTTGAFDGAQISSVNVTTDRFDGAQIGVINVGGKVRGAQIGVINVAEEVDGVALGVVSVSKDSVHPIVWASNLQYMNAGVKLSTKYAYTIVGVHYGTREYAFDEFGVTGAVGGHIPLPAGFDVEVQGSVTSLQPWLTRPSDDGNLWVAPQAIAGYSFARHLRVFAGGGARIPAIVNKGRSVVRPEVLAGVQF